jgi:antitoxin component YwqK of YwqJK toxin-antitoxin module
MKKTHAFLILSTGLLGLFLAGPRTGAAAGQASPPPIGLKIFTWAGLNTGPSTDHNQGRLAGAGGNSDTDYYPSDSSVPKLGQADIVYVRNHGGVVETNPFMPGLEGKPKKTRFVDLGLPTDEDRGPEMVLAWGCENGRSDLIEKYAKGFGVLKDAKTKVYLAPRINVPPYESNFPAFFFEEFAKGDVTVREAARIAYGKWAAKWGEIARSKQNFDGDIGIWGNGDLTLNQIRANTAARRGAAAKSAPVKTEAVPGFPKGALVEREYWDPGKKVLKREYAYILAGGRKIRHGLEKRYFQSGSIEYEATRKLDVLEGTMVRYWANGQKFDESVYKDNVMEGPYQAFHDTGKERAKGQFKKGRKVGEWTTWHWTGHKESMGSYLSDFTLVENVPWDLKNTADVDWGLYHKLGVKTGHWWTYFPSGKKELEEIWGPNGESKTKDGELFGPRRTWYDNAANSPESEIIPGPGGSSTEWYDNGQMRKKCPRGGKCQNWNRDGKEFD